MNRAKCNAQTSSRYKLGGKPRLLQHFPGNLAGIISHRPHGLAVLPFEVIRDRITHRTVNPRMNKAADQFILTQGFNTGNPFQKAFDDFIPAVTDG